MVSVCSTCFRVKCLCILHEGNKLCVTFVCFWAKKNVSKLNSTNRLISVGVMEGLYILCISELNVSLWSVKGI